MPLVTAGQAGADCCDPFPTKGQAEAETLPWPGQWRGPDGFARLVGAINAPTELTVRDYVIIEAGEVVEIRLNAVFTSRKSGRRLPMEIVEHNTVREGKIHGACRIEAMTCPVSVAPRRAFEESPQLCDGPSPWPGGPCVRPVRALPRSLAWRNLEPDQAGHSVGGDVAHQAPRPRRPDDVRE
jgi:hypothetical protein